MVEKLGKAKTLQQKIDIDQHSNTCIQSLKDWQDNLLLADLSVIDSIRNKGIIVLTLYFEWLVTEWCFLTIRCTISPYADAVSLENKFKLD